MRYSYRLSQIASLADLIADNQCVSSATDPVRIINTDVYNGKLSEIILSIKTILDEFIEREINFELVDFPYCLLLGYKRYIKKTVTYSDINLLCDECEFNGVCPGFNPLYLEQSGADEIKPVNYKTHMTDNENCMIKILKYKNDITTSEVLELVKLFPICNDCSTGAHVIAAGQKLIQKEIVTKTLTSNGYIWNMKTE
jgi:hypothetical protein